MSLQKLLASKRLQRHQSSIEEMEALRKLVKRDLADASLRALSADRRFAVACNAALQLSKMLISSAGYRLSLSFSGHHQAIFDVIRHIVGAKGNAYADYFEVCRRKRNIIDYDYADVATESLVEELMEKVVVFKTFVEKWIKSNHPDLA